MKKFKETNALKFRPRKQVFSASNNSFDPKTYKAVSYNWWVYVSKIKGKLVFNNYTYSVTTRKHQSAMQTFLRENKVKIDLIVETRESLGSTKLNDSALENLYESLLNLEIKLPRMRKVNQESTKKAIEFLKRDIKLARKLGAKFSKQAIKELKNSLETAEKERLARLREQRQPRLVTSKEIVEQLNSVESITF